MVMVGPELNIRRYTPQAAKMLGLTASDVGRPITRLRLQLVEVTDLEEIMLNVMAEVRPAHKLLKDSDGQACEMRITPYRTSDNRIDGVVLSVLTVEELKDALEPSPDSGSRSAQKNAAGKKNKKKKVTRQK